MIKRIALWLVCMVFIFNAHAQCTYNWLVYNEDDTTLVVAQSTKEPVCCNSVFPGLTLRLLNSFINDRKVNPVHISVKALIDNARKAKNDSMVAFYENMARELMTRTLWPYQIGKKQIMMGSSCKRAISKNDSVIVYKFSFSDGDEWVEDGAYEIFYAKEFGVIKGYFCGNVGCSKYYTLLSSCLADTQEKRNRLRKIPKFTLWIQ